MRIILGNIWFSRGNHSSKATVHSVSVNAFSYLFHSRPLWLQTVTKLHLSRHLTSKCYYEGLRHKCCLAQALFSKFFYISCIPNEPLPLESPLSVYITYLLLSLHNAITYLTYAVTHLTCSPAIIGQTLTLRTCPMNLTSYFLESQALLSSSPHTTPHTLNISKNGRAIHTSDFHDNRRARINNKQVKY